MLCMVFFIFQSDMRGGPRRSRKEGYPMNYKVIALLILAAVFLYRALISLIQYRSADNPVPANVRDVYDAETYAKWRRYHAEKCRLSLVTGAVTLAVELALILTDLYAAFAGLFPDTPFMQMFGVVLLSVLGDLAGLPVSYYDTMVIEARYGFNRTSRKTFAVDAVKELVISLVISTAIGGLVMVTHQALGDRMILVLAGALTALVLGIAFLYPYFSRVFNRFTPLEAGELRDRLTDLLGRHGYTVRAIQVMDASRRSTKSNAYFSGFGKTKTIVLYDTLVQAMTVDEICAVFAHEMGHGLHRDTLKNQVMSFIRMLLLATLAFLILRTAAIFPDFGFRDTNYGFALVLIMMAFSLVSPLFGLLANALSRRAEFRADAQAVQEGCGDALVSALRKLARENFAELAPSPLLVKLEYSHPPLSERIRAITGE